MHMNTLGERIKYIRERLGYSQKKLAEILGLKSGQSIYEYETNINEPNINSLKNIAKLGKISLDWLIGGEISYNNNDTSNIREPTSQYFTTGNLDTQEQQIIELLRKKPELIPIIKELILTKIKQDELIKKMGNL